MGGRLHVGSIGWRYEKDLGLGPSPPLTVSVLKGALLRGDYNSYYLWVPISVRGDDLI